MPESSFYILNPQPRENRLLPDLHAVPQPRDLRINRLDFLIFLAQFATDLLLGLPVAHMPFVSVCMPCRMDSRFFPASSACRRFSSIWSLSCSSVLRSLSILSLMESAETMAGEQSAITNAPIEYDRHHLIPWPHRTAARKRSCRRSRGRYRRRRA